MKDQNLFLKKKKYKVIGNKIVRFWLTEGMMAAMLEGKNMHCSYVLP